MKGVTSTISGYAGGTLENPTYKNHEGHREAVKIEFDPAVVSYDALVSYFLRTIDVTDDGGQFCDRGESYKSEVFTTSADQKTAAEKALAEASKALGKKIVTPVRPATTFTMAEDYHQNYYLGQNRVSHVSAMSSRPMPTNATANPAAAITGAKNIGCRRLRCRQLNNLILVKHRRLWHVRLFHPRDVK